MDSKTFHTGDILSVTTGVLVGPSHIGGVYQICDYMEQRPHWTHELPDASERVRESILRQVPELAEAYPPEWDENRDIKTQVDEWVNRVCVHIGRNEIELVPCSQEHIDALPPVNPLKTLGDMLD
jgi:hypothetical protein